LAREWDFVMLDIAQAIIFMQNSRGKIMMLNRFREALTFYKKRITGQALHRDDSCRSSADRSRPANGDRGRQVKPAPR
jgi:hypothetical protein